jgi:hypothetical protein
MAGMVVVRVAILDSMNGDMKSKMRQRQDRDTIATQLS